MLQITHPSKKLFRHWWISLITGLLSIAAGIACFVVPADSIAAMTVFFIIVLLSGGIFNVVWALTNRHWNNSWGWGLARGILEILLGIWLMLLPLPLIATMLIYIIGFWMLFQSILGICESCVLSELDIIGWGWMLACNILSLLCAFLFLSAPIYGGIFILAYIGISCILYGAFRIVLALKWRKINKRFYESDNDVIDAEVIN